MKTGLAASLLILGGFAIAASIDGRLAIAGEEPAAPVMPEADQVPPASEGDAEPSTPSSATSVRRALIIVGHPGDEEHRELFTATIGQLRTSLVAEYGFDAESVWVLFGGEDAEETPGLEDVRGPGSQAGLKQSVAELKERLQPDDVLWVIAMGHAHYDRRHAWFNLHGPDLHEETFGDLFDGVACREQVFWITTPASGYYIEPLSGTGRVIISATEADLELNATVFPHALAATLAADATVEPGKESTTTQSLLDLYLAVTQRVAEQFAADMQLATEHALLEANGDGRGTEIQFDYLPLELGGRLEEGASPAEPLPNSDAAAARAIEVVRHVVKSSPGDGAESGEEPPNEQAPNEEAPVEAE